MSEVIIIAIIAAAAAALPPTVLSLLTLRRIKPVQKVVYEIHLLMKQNGEDKKKEKS